MSANTFPHVIEVASVSELASVHVAELQYGTRAFVDAVKDNFYLQPTSQFPVDGTTVVSPVTGAIVGKPGSVWVISAKAGAEDGSPITMVLAGDEQNTTAVLAPSSLQVPIAAGGHMRVEWELKMAADAADGLQVEVTAPPGAAGIVSVIFYVSGGGIGGVDLALNTPLNEVVPALTLFIVAGVINGPTAGFVGVSFAQSVHNNANPTTIHGGSTVMGTNEIF